MNVDPSPSTGGLSDIPRLRSPQVQFGGEQTIKEARGNRIEDQTIISSQLAAALRRNNAQMQEAQGCVTRARIALAGLDEIQLSLQKAISPASEKGDPRDFSGLLSSVKDVVARLTFEGKAVLAGLVEDLNVDSRSSENPRDAILEAVREVGRMRERFAHEIESARSQMGALDVERANHLAVMQVRTLKGPVEVNTVLREVGTRMTEIRPQIERNLQPQSVVEIL